MPTPTPLVPTDDEIDAAISRSLSLGQETIQTAATKQGGNEGFFRQLGQGIANAPAGALGALIALPEKTMGLGFPPADLGLSDFVTRALTPPQFAGPPTSPMGQIGSRIGEEMGVNVPLSFLGPGGLVVRSVNAARMTGLSATAGLAAGVTQQMTQGSSIELPAEMAAQTAVYGPAALGPGAIARGLTQAEKVFPPLREHAIRTQLERGIAENVVDPAAARSELARVEQIQRDIPNFAAPGLGTASGDLGLQGVELAARRQSPKVEAEFRNRIQESAKAIQSATVNLLPRGAASAESIPAELLKREAAFANTVEKAKREINTVLTRADEALTQAVNQQNPKFDRQRAGLRVTEEIRKAYATSTKTAKDLYTPLKPVDRIPVSPAGMNTLREHFAQVVGEFGIGQMPDTFPTYAAQKIQVMLKAAEEGKATIGDLRDLRTTLGYLLQDKRSAPQQNRLLLKRLGELEKANEVTIDNLLTQSPVTPEQRTAYERANTFYREEVADKFLRGPVADIFIGGPLGEHMKLSPAEVVTTFVNTGEAARADAQALKAALGDRATETFRMAALSDLYKHAYDDVSGAVDMGLHRRWLTSHKEALQEFPSINKELRDTATLSARVDQYRQLLFDPRSPIVVGSAFRKPADMQTATAELFLKEDPKIAMQRVLESASPLQGIEELKNAVQGDPRAIAGLRIGVWEHMTREAGLTGPYGDWWQNGSSIKQMLVKNHDILAKSGLFPASHLRRLENIAEGDEILRRVPRELSPKIQDPISQSLMREAVPAATSRLYAAARHAVGETYIVSLALTSRMAKLLEGISNDKQRELLEAMLFNPKLSQTFDDIWANRIGPEKGNKVLKTWMLNLGIESRTREQQQKREER